MTDSTDWQDLIQKHLDGLTSKEEATALSDQIVNDDAVRSDYLKAARIHGALGDETLGLDLETVPFPQSGPRKDRRIQPIAWPRHLAASLVACVFVGLVGLGVVRAVSTPQLEASYLPIANGDFEGPLGQTEIGFPATFGHWSGDPAEVVEGANGNRRLRFLETANVTGKPNGGASACNVFQLIDLSALRQQWDIENSDAQFTLELSARFHREAASNDAEIPRLKATCTIHLYQAEPESIGKGWPMVINEALSTGNKVIRLEPGDEPAAISASCLLDPKATIALISVNTNARTPTTTPIPLGGYFVDDVQLTLIKQPKLPMRFVK
jgi:hypothetical protein